MYARRYLAPHCTVCSHKRAFDLQLNETNETRDDVGLREKEESFLPEVERKTDCLSAVYHANDTTRLDFLYKETVVDKAGMMLDVKRLKVNILNYFDSYYCQFKTVQNT